MTLQNMTLEDILNNPYVFLEGMFAPEDVNYAAAAGRAYGMLTRLAMAMTPDERRDVLDRLASKEASSDEDGA
jgi:hypothetical protein